MSRERTFAGRIAFTASVDAAKLKTISTNKHNFAIALLTFRHFSPNLLGKMDRLLSFA